jgi:hypothetical protein
MKDEDYPGQAYFHQHNPDIKRAEENFLPPIDWSQVDGVEYVRIMSKEEVAALRSLWRTDPPGPQKKESLWRD